MGSIDISHEESNLIFKKLLNEQFKPEQTENLTLAMNFKINQSLMELQTKVGQVQTELKEVRLEVKELKTQTDAEFMKIRAEMEVEFARSRAEFKTDLAKIKEEMAQIHRSIANLEGHLINYIQQKENKKWNWSVWLAILGIMATLIAGGYAYIQNFFQSF